MSNIAQTNLPKSLNQARKRFERWRQTHQPRSRFSEKLWSEAVALAREYGHNLTARTLGLDYYSLKKRLSAFPAVNNGNKNAVSPFIELIPPGQAECIMEIEDGEGGKMRISLKGGTMPDMASLSRSFWMRDA